MRVRTCSQRSPVTSPVLAAEEPEFPSAVDFRDARMPFWWFAMGAKHGYIWPANPFAMREYQQNRPSGRRLDMDRQVFHSFFHSCGKLAGTPQPRGGVHVSALDDARGRTTLTHRPPPRHATGSSRPKRRTARISQARTLSL